ncbi:MAG: hypothetical protein OXJ53_06120 [Gammaproteobacteria bacterium]|nr:hypothetical protein [Gammaproteobacteria bacterium]
MRIVNLAVAALCLALLAGIANESAAQAGGLFASVDGGGPAAAAVPEGALRSRLVRVDQGRLWRVRAAAADIRTARERPKPSNGRLAEAQRAPNASLRLNLFSGVAVTAVVERVEPTFSGGYSLAGGLVEDPAGSMVLVVNGDRVVGSVDAGGRSYRIQSAGGGLHSISEVEQLPMRCGVDAHRPTSSLF